MAIMGMSLNPLIGQKSLIESRIEASSRSSETVLVEPLGHRVRGEFPVLDQEIDGKALVYLDSGATSQKPRRVLDVERAYYEYDNANVHRGAHTLATRATEAYENARIKVANFIHAKEASEIVFTRGATEAINLVAASFGDQLEKGDEIVISVIEHHANLVPWQLLASRKNLNLKFIRLNADKSNIDLLDAEKQISEKTKMLAIFHVSNVLGCRVPLDDLQKILKAKAHPDCAILLDACQSVPHMPVNVQDLNIDFLVASAHKMCGPMGVGFLWGKAHRLHSMAPWQGGGEMIDQVSLEKSTFALPPARFEAGTPPVAQAIALGAAIDFLNDIGMKTIHEYEQHLARKLVQGLSSRSGITIYGPLLQREVALVAFNVQGIHASDLSFFLDQEGVATRAGHHCTQPLHHALDADSGSCRVSLALYNTPEEIDLFLEKLDHVIEFFSASSADASILQPLDAI